MIPALALIIGSYVVLRCVDIATKNAQRTATWQKIVIVLCAMVALVAIYSVIVIQGAGMHLSLPNAQP